MGTKEKILKAALRLFNEQGVENISARNIAAELNISDGNLRYHFRTKEEVVYQLYLQLVAEFDQKTHEFENGSINLNSIFQFLNFVFSRMDEHKFIMTDFVAIMRKYPKIKEHYQQLYRFRMQQMGKLINTLIAEDIFRKDITIAQYQHMAEHLTILSDFWISSAEIFYQEEASEKHTHYIHLVFSLLVPYLTKKGLYEYAILTDA